MQTMPSRKYALILGVSSGFGAAAAKALARDGFNIFGVHLDRAAGVKLAEGVKADIESHGVSAHFYNVNAADPDKRREVIESIQTLCAGQEDAGVGLLLHSLAFGSLRSFIGATPDEPVIKQRQMEMTMDVMANSLVYWTQDLFTAGLLKRGSRIVGMSSGGSERALPAYGAVSGAKAALEAYIRQLGLELGPFGITANSIRAGVTYTPALNKIPGNDIIMDIAQMRNPAHRLTTPEDVAKIVALIAREDSYWVNGTVIVVDGGENAVDLTWWKKEEA